MILRYTFSAWFIQKATAQFYYPLNPQGIAQKTFFLVLYFNNLIFIEKIAKYF